ncbi:ribosomal protein S8 [Pseudomassariella vexata]|uniref:Ribosomal protein S8 n=1 Tax=Pseudomassariella vexata TaxID=1141098 RepID=A0A1Y2EFC5_9PEZI|nr:ribosomal protein S8 [Pseudomassariella vexata]ORY70259.1 ribosomal protein S8 [Pseudomassariella vexata]
MPHQSIAHICSHMQNASRARLALTSTPHSKFHLNLLLSMQRTGFLSFVTRGGLHPPDPATLSTYVPPPLTSANVAKQRLWVGLKYSNNEPVLKHMKVISKPTRPVTLKLEDLERIARGWDAGGRMMQRGLNLGECMFVSTPKGVMEIREAVERKMGGLLLCRVSP